MGWTAPRTASACQDGRCHQPICREAVHGQVYPEYRRCHAGRARSGEERVSGSRCRREGRDCRRAQARARPAGGFLRRIAAVSGGDGGVLLGSPLGAGAGRARARGSTAAAGACEALCQAQQERRGRRGGDLRGGGTAWPALRAGPFGRQPGGADAPPGARAPRRPAHVASQRLARAHGRDRHRGAARGATRYHLKRLAADGFDEVGEIVVPECVRVALRPLIDQIDALDETIGAIDRELEASVKTDETARRLMTIPGVGPVTASAITATIQDMSAFASGREFSAYLGLTPRQSSTGGKERLGRITKMGDRYLRKLLVVGACATLSHREGHNDALRRWASGMLERKMVKYKFKLTAVALANKVARIVFVLMTRGGQYDGRPVAA